LDRVAELTGREPIVYIADVLDRPALKNIFANHNITDVIHFAGLKSVSESIKEPLADYENHVNGTLVLRDEMQAPGGKRLL
ncbi:GDP-mannose 4,6-dehydratase, partial [Escherichia coli]